MNMVQQESTRTPLKRRKCYSPTSRKARVFKAPSQRSYKIHHQRFFSYESFNARKKKNLVPTSYLQEEYKIRRQVILSYDSLNSKKAKDFLQQATYKGNVPCVLNQEFLFFGSRVLGFRSNPSWLKYWLLRDLVYEEAMCKGSTGNRLLYAAKAAPQKDYFTHVENPAAKHS